MWQAFSGKPYKSYRSSTILDTGVVKRRKRWRWERRCSSPVEEQGDVQYAGAKNQGMSRLWGFEDERDMDIPRKR